MDLNIVALSYFFLRLAPFVLVCFFSLSSIFNQDFKGLVYLVGLIFASFGSMLFANIFDIIDQNILTKPNARPEICNMLTVNGMELSRLPLAQNTFGFTFAYLLFAMITNSSIPDSKKNNPWYSKIFSYSLFYQNIPTIIFFTLLIVFDFVWNLQNTCYTWPQLLISLSFGAAFGLLWGKIINSTNTDTLTYFSGYNNNEVCSKPSKQTFQCKVYKNGQVIANNFA